MDPMDIACFMVEPCNPHESPHGFGRFDIRRIDTGEIVATDTYGYFRGDAPGQCPAGAMAWVMHRPESELHAPMDQSGGTQRHLLVVTPGGTWCTGCPATDSHAHWRMSGEPPLCTVTPSIDLGHGHYHGYLHDGVLIDA